MTKRERARSSRRISRRRRLRVDDHDHVVHGGVVERFGFWWRVASADWRVALISPIRDDFPAASTTAGITGRSYYRHFAERAPRHQEATVVRRTARRRKCRICRMTDTARHIRCQRCGPGDARSGPACRGLGPVLGLSRQAFRSTYPRRSVRKPNQPPRSRRRPCCTPMTPLPIRRRSGTMTVRR
jgi:hypothetical protein